MNGTARPRGFLAHLDEVIAELRKTVTRSQDYPSGADDAPPAPSGWNELDAFQRTEVEAFVRLVTHRPPPRPPTPTEHEAGSERASADVSTASAAMPDCRRPSVVGVFNASADTVEMLEVLLSSAGYLALDGRVDDIKSGVSDFIAFLEVHRPDALVWDISPPYDRNWRFFKLVRSLRHLEHCAIILTTTHQQHLNEFVGEDVGALEIVGKPYDLQAVVNAVERQLQERRRVAAPRVFTSKRG
jgi:CheY-like chemotaxis protein